MNGCLLRSRRCFSGAQWIFAPRNQLFRVRRLNGSRLIERNPRLDSILNPLPASATSTVSESLITNLDQIKLTWLTERAPNHEDRVPFHVHRQ